MINASNVDSGQALSIRLEAAGSKTMQSPGLDNQASIDSGAAVTTLRGSTIPRPADKRSARDLSAMRYAGAVNLTPPP